VLGGVSDKRGLRRVSGFYLAGQAGVERENASPFGTKEVTESGELPSGEGEGFARRERRKEGKGMGRKKSHQRRRETSQKKKKGGVLESGDERNGGRGGNVKFLLWGGEETRTLRTPGDFEERKGHELSRGRI